MGHLGGAKAVDAMPRFHQPFSGETYDSVARGPGGLNSRAMEAWRTFIGEPDAVRKWAFLSKQYDRGDYQQELEDFPEAFGELYAGGPSEHMATTIIEKTTAARIWPLYMAPWKKSNDMRISWKRHIYEQHMLDRTPEESVPRYVYNRSEKGEATLNRYAIAFVQEATFAATLLGQKRAAHNCEQIVEASVNTACFGAVITVLTRGKDPSRRPPRRDINDATGRQKLIEKYQYETSMFGVMQKDGGGMDTIRQIGEQEIADNNGGARANFCVIPAGCERFTKGTMDGKFYKTGGLVSREAASSFKPTGLGKLAVVESHAFNTGDGVLSDPFYTRATIGGFMTLDDHLLDQETAQSYKTAQMTSQGYDGQGDRYHDFRVEDYYKFAGVWDFRMPDCNITNTIGKQFLRDIGCYTYGQAYARCTERKKFDQVLEKLASLPHDKKQECLNTLRVLNENDLLAQHELPTTWDEKAFDTMLSNNKIQASTIYSVAEHIKFAQDKERGRFQLADDTIAYETYMAAQRGGVKRKRMADVGTAVATATPLPSPFASPFAAFAAGGVVPMQVDMDEEKEASPFIPLTGGNDQMRDERADLQKEIKTMVGELASNAALGLTTAGGDEALCEEYLDNLKEAIGRDRAAHATMLREIAGILRDQRAIQKQLKAANVQVPFSLLETWATVIAPELGRQQLTSVLSGIRSNFTYVETKLREEKTSPDTVPFLADDVLQSSWASVPTPSAAPAAGGDAVAAPPSLQRRDGKFVLASVLVDGSAGVPLPHDALAPTVCANHVTLFKFDTQMAEGIWSNARAFIQSVRQLARMRQERQDAFLWSCLLSAMLQHRSFVVRDPNTGARSLNMAALHANLHGQGQAPLLKDLKEIIANVDIMAPALPSQAHLATVVQCASAILEGCATTANLNALQQDGPTTDSLTNVNNALLAFRVANADWVAKLRNTWRVGPSKPDAALAAPDAPALHPASSGGRVQLEWTEANIRGLLMRATLASGAFFRFCIQNDVRLPFLLRLFRPYKTYLTGKVLRMIAGEHGAARTYFMNPDWMWSQNAAQKMVFGHYSVYFKTIVTEPKMIHIFDNAFIQKYIGGHGVQAWNPLNESHKQHYKDGRLDRDIFVTMQPMNRWCTPSFFLPFTGRLPTGDTVDVEFAKQMYYPACEAITTTWAVPMNGRAYGGEDGQSVHNPKSNQMCMQELQIRYDSKSKQITHVIRDQGHLGDVYAGHLKVINKAVSHFQVPDYVQEKRMSLD